VAVASGHSGGDYSFIYIRYTIFFCSLPYSSSFRLLLLLISLLLLFLVSPLASHSSLSFSSAPSPCSSCSRFYSVSPVFLSFYNITTCRIVSSEVQTNERFCSVRLQSARISCFPHPHNMRALRSLRTLASLKHCSLFFFKNTFLVCYTFYFLSDNLPVAKPP